MRGGARQIASKVSPCGSPRLTRCSQWTRRETRRATRRGHPSRWPRTCSATRSGSQRQGPPTQRPGRPRPVLARVRATRGGRGSPRVRVALGGRSRRSRTSAYNMGGPLSPGVPYIRTRARLDILNWERRIKGDYTLLYVSVWSVVGASSVGAVACAVLFVFGFFFTIATLRDFCQK